MNWDEVENTLRTHIEENWVNSEFSSTPLVWENENELDAQYYMALNIEGTFAEKSIYGSVGKRNSIEAGIVFFHNFVPVGIGKILAVKPVVVMAGILELQTVGSYIDLEGANPPSPVHYGIDELDREIPTPQPSGNYYRCSGSVPFIVRGNR